MLVSTKVSPGNVTKLVIVWVKIVVGQAVCGSVRVVVMLLELLR